MPDKFDKFTERARKVLNLAQEEAHRFNHNYIGTEHILLGLVREGDGVAARVLANLNVELHKVRAAVELIIGRNEGLVIGDVGLTPRAKKVVELAIDEARKLNHHYIGTEHLLLGLVREGEGIAAGVLESLGVSLEQVRTEVMNVLNASGGSQPQRSEPEPANFSRLNADAQHVLILAQQEASRLGHRYIGAEHILLGVVVNPDSVAAQALTSMGLDLAEVGIAVEEIIGKGEQDDKLAVGHAGLTPRAARVIALALKEAQRQGREYVGSEDLLIALFREADQSRRPDSVVARTTRKLFTGAVPEGEGIAAGVLTGFGVDAPKVQATLDEIYVKAAKSYWNEIIASDRFTEQAQQVMKLAGEEALRFNHNYIGTEHILLGLVRVGDSIAAQVLANLYVELHKVRSAVEFIIGRSGQLVVGDIGLTPRAKKVLELSLDEARRMGQQQVGPEHLLLGLVREGEGIAAGVLESMGASLEQVRAEALKRMNPKASFSSGPQNHVEPGYQHTENPDADYSPTLEQMSQGRQSLGGKFDKFNEYARRVLAYATEEAYRFNHNYIGTEHILLGLMRVSDSTAARALANLRVELDKVYHAVEFIIGRGQKLVVGDIGLTPRSKKSIELAIDEARKLNHHYIGTEHLLLGLMREGEGIAAGILFSLGISLERVRNEVMKLIKETSQNE